MLKFDNVVILQLFFIGIISHSLLIYYVKKRFNLFKEITILNVSIIFIYAFNVIGFPIIFFQIDSYRSEFLNDISLIAKLFFTILSSIIALVMGANLIKSRHSLKSLFGVQEEVKVDAISYIFLFASVILSVGACYSYLQVVGIFNLPIAIFFGENIDPTLSRSMTGVGLPNFGWYQLFFNDVGLIGLGIWLSLLKYKPNNIARLGFCIFLFFIIFTYLMSGEKAKIIDVLIFLFLVLSLFKGGVYNWKNVIMLMSLSVCFLLPLYWVLMNDKSLSSALWGIVSRVTTGTLQAGYHHLEFVKETGQIYGGLTFPNPLGLLPFEPIPYTQNLMDWVHGETTIGGKKIIGSMPTHYWGEMYVNFGYPGIFVGSVIFGAYLQMVHRMFYPTKSTALGISLYAWLCIHFKDIALTGLTSFLVDKKFIIVLALIVVCACVSSLIPKKSKENMKRV